MDKTIDFYVPISSIVLLSDCVQTVLTVCYVIILVFAVGGNFYAIFIICRARLSNVSTKLYLWTLAISDLVLIAAAIPVDLSLITSQYHSWVLGSFLCETASSYFQMLAVMLNAFCLFIIALQRYLSVTGSLGKSKVKFSSKPYFTYLTLSGVWIISLVAAIPQIWAYSLHTYKTYDDLDPNFNASNIELSNEIYFICFQPTEKIQQTNTFFYCFVGVIFAILLIGFLFCYLSIIQFVKTHGTKFERRQGPIEPSTTETVTKTDTNVTQLSTRRISKPPKNRHRRTVRLIMALILIFCICRIPVWIFLIVVNLVRVQTTSTMLALKYFLNVLSNLSTALSPFMYAIWNKSLRSDSSSPRMDHGTCALCSGVAFSWNEGRKNKLSLFVLRPLRKERYDLSEPVGTNRTTLDENNEIVEMVKTKNRY